MNTKKFSFPCRYLTIFVILLFSVTAYSQDIDTTIVKSTTLGAKDLVYLKNPFVDAAVKTWDKQEVRVEYHLSVAAKEYAEARDFIHTFDQILDRQLTKDHQGKVYTTVAIDQMSHSNNRVKVKFTGDKHFFLLTDFSGTLTVYMPRNHALNAQAAFRKLEIDDLDADAVININSTELRMGNCHQLDLKSGFSRNIEIGHVKRAFLHVNSSDLRITDIATDLTLEGSFSSVETGKIGNHAEIALNSSAFESGDIGTLALKGSFIRSFEAGDIGTTSLSLNSSTFEAQKITSLDVDKMSFTTLNIEETGEITINAANSSKFLIDRAGAISVKRSSFSDFIIGNLTRLFTVDARSGKVNLENVEKGFEKIDISGSFLTTKIAVAKGGDYVLSANLSFPDYHFDGLNIENRVRDLSHEELEGWKGNAEARSSIHLTCQSCEITVH